MKRRAMSIAICLLMITSVSAPIARNAGQLSSGGIIYVDDDNTSGIEDGSLQYPFNAIQEGIDAASLGDTVFVFSGTYYEHIVVGKSINLQGENRDATIIDGGGSGDVVLIAADSVNMTGFTVTNSGGYRNCGIYMNEAKNCIITTNNISSNLDGIYIYDSDYSNITDNNIFSNNKRGIYLLETSYTIISSNIFSNNYGGMATDFSDENPIYHNNFIYNIEYQAIDDMMNELFWDNGYPSGGNYWSDYPGVDHCSGVNQDIPGSDGIGDTPQVYIYAQFRVIDNYPLISPYGISNQPPIADAGPDQSVNEGDVVQFDGSGSYDPDEEWQITTIDTTCGYGGFISLALDENDNPHISYFDDANDDLKYAKWDGNTWNIETVDSDGLVGLHTSLALDANGNPHISYQKYGVIDLKYAKWTGSSWNIETVDSTDEAGFFTSIAIDTSGNPHISYFTGWPVYDFKYARWDGSTWNVETIESDRTVGHYTSLALDSNDNPHISYHHSSDGDLKYTRWDGSTWNIETVDSSGVVGFSTSLALDADDNPHISYHDVTESDLKYARWTGSVWNIETVDSLGFVGDFTSLALDAKGEPHIGYYDHTNGDLKHAKRTGSTWKIETVDKDGLVGLYTSLALDSNDNPHMSYFDFTNGYLKYTKKVGGILSYEWDFDASFDSDGDGNPTNDVDATGPTPTHIYNAVGVYTVTLLIRDNDGAYDTDTCIITVLTSNQPPVANAGPDQTVNEGDIVLLDGSDSAGGSQSQEPDCIALWHMNEGSGNMIYDSTVNNNDGTINGATWTAEGRWGNALSFNGADDFVDAGPNNIYGDGNAITVEAWFKVNNLDSQETCILGSGSRWWGPNSGGFHFLVRDNGRLDFYLYFSPTWRNAVSQPSDIQTGKWYQMVGVYDGSIKLYLNGVLKESIPWPGGFDQSASRVLFGGVPGTINFNGTIDEVVIWDRALSAQEILDCYNSGKEHFTGGESPIVSYEWDFESDGIYDYQETSTNAPDGAFDGKTTHIYGDDGVYTVTLRVTDGGSATDTDTCIVTVNNVAPYGRELLAHGDFSMGTDGWHQSLHGYVGPGSIPPLPPSQYSTSTDNGYLDTRVFDGYNQLYQDVKVNTTDLDFHARFRAVDFSTYGGLVDVKVRMFSAQPPGWSGNPPDYSNLSIIQSLIVGQISWYFRPDYVYPSTNTSYWELLGTGPSDWHVLDINLYDIIAAHLPGIDESKVKWLRIWLGTYGESGGFTIGNFDDISLRKPIIMGPNSASEGGKLIFTAQAEDPGSDDLTFTWNWGDGSSDTVITYYNNGTGPEPLYDPATNEIRSPLGIYPFNATDTVNHTYGDDGVYTITLTVEDDDGGTTTASISVTVNNVAPNIGSTTTPPGNEGSPITFTSTATDPGSDDLTFTWDWGDGTSSTSTTYHNDGTGPDPYPSPLGIYPFTFTDTVTHIYGDNGVYTITLTAEDDDGGTRAITKNVTVYNVVPTITLVITPSGDEGEELIFTADATDAGSDDLNFTWKFEHGPTITNTYHNDGMNPDPPQSPGGNYPFSASDNVIHTYGDDYNYTLTLSVTDDDGGMATYTTTVTIDNIAPSIILFAIPIWIEEGVPATYVATAEDQGSDDLTFKWLWDDGTPVDIHTHYNNGISPDHYPSPNGTFPFIASETMNHTYGDNGVYNITLTVEDDDGGMTTYSTGINIQDIAPIIDMVKAQGGDEGAVLTFSSNATDQGSDDLIFTWNWGDGTAETMNIHYNDGLGPDPPRSPFGAYPFTASDTVTHTYGDNGEYTITLTVEDDDGGMDIARVKITVNNVAPSITSFNYTILKVNEPRTIGYWGHQCEVEEPYGDHTGVLQEWIDNISSQSQVFSWISTKDDVESIVQQGDASDMIVMAKRQLMGVWLDVVSGKLHPATEIDMPALTTSKTVWEAILEIEDAILNPDNRAELERVKDISDNINNGIGIALGIAEFTASATDPGADDLTFYWNFGDGKSQYNFHPNPGGVFPISASDIVVHSYFSPGTFTVTLTVSDDDGGSSVITQIIAF